MRDYIMKNFIKHVLFIYLLPIREYQIYGEYFKEFTELLSVMKRIIVKTIIAITLAVIVVFAPITCLVLRLMVYIKSEMEVSDELNECRKDYQDNRE